MRPLAAAALAAAMLLANAAPAQTLRIGLREDPDVLDPTLARTYVGRIVFASLCDKLFDIDEQLRIVITPKSRNVDADVLMESLFKLTDLEVRIPLNMNVLDEGRPGVLGLKPVIAKWLIHQREVLIARSRYRLGRIEAIVRRQVCRKKGASGVTRAGHKSP